MPVDVVSIAANAIDVLASETINIIRRPGGSYRLGLWVSADPTTETGVAASVQPMTGDLLRTVPKNRRNEENILIYCRSELHPGAKRKTREGQAREPDRVEWNGATYEVYESAPWGGRYYEAMASRVGDQ